MRQVGVDVQRGQGAAGEAAMALKSDPEDDPATLYAIIASYEPSWF